jgi:hypothetical protein
LSACLLRCTQGQARALIHRHPHTHRPNDGSRSKQQLGLFLTGHWISYFLLRDHGHAANRIAALFSEAVSHVAPEVTAFLMPSLLCPAWPVLCMAGVLVLSGVVGVECVYKRRQGALYQARRRHGWGGPQRGGGMDGVMQSA